jgi:hypothetical protein
MSHKAASDFMMQAIAAGKFRFPCTRMVIGPPGRGVPTPHNVCPFRDVFHLYFQIRLSFALVYMYNPASYFCEIFKEPHSHGG